MSPSSLNRVRKFVPSNRKVYDVIVEHGYLPANSKGLPFFDHDNLEDKSIMTVLLNDRPEPRGFLNGLLKRRPPRRKLFTITWKELFERGGDNLIIQVHGVDLVDRATEIAESLGIALKCDAHVLLKYEHAEESQDYDY